MKSEEEVRLKKTAFLAEVKLGFHVLDLGCGKMRIRRFLPKEISYYGVDINPVSEKVIEHNLELGLPEKIKGIRFDVIFMSEFLEHVENFKTLLTECGKNLKEGGKIILSTPSSNRFIIKEDPHHIHCFRKTNMINLARICNLEVTKIIGTAIVIPVLHLCIPSNQTFYNNSIIYRLEPNK